MYKLLSIFILIAILFLILNHCRKRKIICRIRCMIWLERAESDIPVAVCPVTET